MYLLLQEPSPAPENRTRLLFPFVSNQAGFDAGLAIANTGKDSSGVVGVAGNCTVYYFGSTANGGAAPEPETTTVPVSPGETFTFVLSSGGAKGIRGAPNFQGYIEVDCAFPFAHGFALLTDGPIGQAKVGTTVPALVLPRKRTNAEVESVGQ